MGVSLAVYSTENWPFTSNVHPCHVYTAALRPLNVYSTPMASSVPNISAVPLVNLTVAFLLKSTSNRNSWSGPKLTSRGVSELSYKLVNNIKKKDVWVITFSCIKSLQEKRFLTVNQFYLFIKYKGHNGARDIFRWTLHAPENKQVLRALLLGITCCHYTISHYQSSASPKAVQFTLSDIKCEFIISTRVLASLLIDWQHKTRINNISFLSLSSSWKKKQSKMVTL